MYDPESSLEIFIIGGRLGESIVLRTPGGAFGVVDAYASDWKDSDKNPTLARLKSLGAKKLRFVVMSHPHMDHFRGLLSIFQFYQGQIESFWRAPWGGVEDLYKLLFREFKQESNDARREFLARGKKILRELLDAADAEVKSSAMDSITLQNDSKAKYDGVFFQEQEHDFSIMCLGPSTNMASPYSKNIAARVFGQARQAQLSGWKAPHNDISTVLAVKYGEWVGILGGDTEQASWNDILRRRAALLSDTRFFKISHHGSPTGSFAALWNSIKSDSCEAVVTCFSHQGLPNEAGLRCMRDPRFRLHSTNKALAEDLYKGKRPAPVPAEFKISNKAGEIKLTVDAGGQMKIDYFDPAGPVRLQ